MDDTFLQTWHEAASTTVGLFWMALWAFALGYLISSMIQVFVTQERMRRTMGDGGVRSIALGGFFGFVSSSCSFAALSATRALFVKGASLSAALAFLLGSTNLVVELGIIIALFLGWQFVVGEYVGGVLLILVTALLLRIIRPQKMIEKAREHAAEKSQSGDIEVPDWRALLRSREGWGRVASQYASEWGMVWKDVTVGFTVAGAIAAFVPAAFFETLFVGSGTDDPTFWQIVAQALIAPIAAFFTFIGSMGNIPLAAVLFGSGVSFAGVMAFIFSDLVVLPVLRIQAQYYGWPMALFILGLFLTALVVTAVTLHYAFAAAGLLPDPSATKAITDREFFAVDYTLFLNIAALVLSGVFIGWRMRRQPVGTIMGSGPTEKTLFVLAVVAYAWLAIGLVLPLIGVA